MSAAFYFVPQRFRLSILVADAAWSAEFDYSILNQLQNQVEQLREKIKQQNNELNEKNDEIENVSVLISIIVLWHLY